MIEAENYGKITEIYLKIPLKIAKNFRGDGGGPALPDRGVFQNFQRQGGFWLTPPWPCLALIKSFLIPYYPAKSGMPV